MKHFEKLLPPQKPHAIRLLTSLYLNGVAFDGSDTGCGKTFSACFVASQVNAPIVVIAPKSVLTMWNKLLNTFGVTSTVTINYELLCRGKTQWLSYNKKEYDVKKCLKGMGINIKFPKNALVILDESHKCKGAESHNGNMAMALRTLGYKVLLLSATAATNVLDMKSFGYNLNLHNGENFNDFCLKYGAEWLGKFGRMIFNPESPLASEGMTAIHDSIFHKQMIGSRMTKEEFGDIFPKNRITADPMDMGDVATPKIKKLYENMMQELALLEERCENYSFHIFAVIMKYRRQTELLKVPVMLDWIEDRYDEGISPVLFVNFTDTVDCIMRRLCRKNKYIGKIAQVVGGQSPTVRDRNVDEFQADIRRIMIANMDSGSAGLNFHDLNGKFPRHSMINPTYKAIAVQQAVGRIHRAHGKTPCMQTVLYALDGSYEESMAQRFSAKLNNLSLLNDRDFLPESIRFI